MMALISMVTMWRLIALHFVNSANRRVGHTEAMIRLSPHPLCRLQLRPARRIDVRDLLAERLRSLADAAGYPVEGRFTRCVKEALDALFQKGVRAAVGELVGRAD
jgi:hypothetical protein